MIYPDPLPPGGPSEAPMLVPLDTLKALLGVAPAVKTFDPAIEFAGQVASALVIDYTGRNLVRATYTEAFRGPPGYAGAWPRGEAGMFYSLSEFPSQGIGSITINGLDAIGRVRSFHFGLSLLYLDGIGTSDDVVIEYVAGYDPLPASLTALVLELVRRQLGAMGVDLSLATAAAGSGPVKAVSIGALKVEYVVSTTAADVAAGQASPLLADTLGQFAHVLDMYRSPSRLVAM